MKLGQRGKVSDTRLRLSLLLAGLYAVGGIVATNTAFLFQRWMGWVSVRDQNAIWILVSLWVAGSVMALVVTFLWRMLLHRSKASKEGRMFLVFSVVLVLALVLPGCTAHRPPEPPLVAAPPAPEPPSAPPAPSEAELTTPGDPELIAAVEELKKTGKAPVIKKPSIVRYPYQATQEVSITCPPLRFTTIRLEAGEEVNNVGLGDQVRWHAQAAFLGDPPQVTPLLLVKPLDAAARTDLTVVTNRRIYHFLLIPGALKGRTREISFWFPDDELAKLNGTFRAAAKKKDEQTVARFPNLNVERLNFDYTIDGDHKYMVQQAFDDGQHVYLKMHPDVAVTAAPVLMVETQDGRGALVNYRVKQGFYVLDQLFRRASLFTTGSQEPAVTITKRGH